MNKIPKFLPCDCGCGQTPTYSTWIQLKHAIHRAKRVEKNPKAERIAGLAIREAEAGNWWFADQLIQICSDIGTARWWPDAVEASKKNAHCVRRQVVVSEYWI